jgi:pyrroloquinoline quinone (PQQ) biosynthesis protein C
MHGNPLQRLGYSYWAETSYEYIRDFIDAMGGNMELTKRQMTFFYNHSTIDDKHAKDVENILLHCCNSKDDWDAVEQAAIITLDLTHQILKSVLEEYEKLVKVQPSLYEIVNMAAGPRVPGN